MTSLDRKVNLFLKKFLPQQQFADNFLEYLLKQSRDEFQRMYPFEGVFSGGDMSGFGANQFELSNPLFGTDGQGHVILLDPADSIVVFENTLASNYHVGLRYNEIPRETEVNVRTGNIEYTFIEERIGEKSLPNLVVDNGTSITLRIDSVAEAGVTNAGRIARAYLKRAVSQVDAFYEGNVTFTGGFNVLEVPHLFGQAVGLVSTNPADYEVFLVGPTVRKNTNLNNDPNIAYLGYVVGAGAGNTPSSFNQSGRTNLYNGNTVTPLVDYSKLFLVGGGLVTWDQGTSTLTWASDLKLVLPNRSYGFTISAGSQASIANGDVLYVQLDTIGGIVPIVKVASGSVPNDVYALPIALRHGNDIFFRDGALELKGDATTPTAGRINDITQDLLTYIGATSESDADPNYSSTNIVSQGGSLTTAVGQLDAAIQAILDDAGDEQIFTATAAQQIFNITDFTFSASNTDYDILVWVNGKKQTQDPDGLLNKDFRKNSTTQLEFSYGLPLGAEVTVFLIRSGSAATGSQLEVRDENAVVDSSVSQLNFEGSGVVAQQTSPGIIKILIPGAGGGAENLQKLVKNMTGAAFPPFSVLAWLDDGTVALADANTVSLSDFAGININSIADGDYGYVVKNGNIPGAAASLSALPGQAVYIGETPGTMTLTAPIGITDTVFKVGRAEPPNGLAQPAADDLFLELEVISEP